MLYFFAQQFLEAREVLVLSLFRKIKHKQRFLSPFIYLTFRHMTVANIALPPLHTRPEAGRSTSNPSLSSETPPGTRVGGVASDRGRSRRVPHPFRVPLTCWDCCLLLRSKASTWAGWGIGRGSMRRRLGQLAEHTALLRINFIDPGENLFVNLSKDV